MRKTRLVILPTKCLHQMGFLLLFLSCPVIGDWGRIRPESENSHNAIQIEREGTCGLERDPPGGLIGFLDENGSKQCRLSEDSTTIATTKMPSIEATRSLERRVDVRRIDQDIRVRMSERRVENVRRTRSAEERRDIRRESERRIQRDVRSRSVESRRAYTKRNVRARSLSLSRLENERAVRNQRSVLMTRNIRQTESSRRERLHLNRENERRVEQRRINRGVSNERRENIPERRERETVRLRTTERRDIHRENNRRTTPELSMRRDNDMTRRQSREKIQNVRDRTENRLSLSRRENGARRMERTETRRSLEWVNSERRFAEIRKTRSLELLSVKPERREDTQRREIDSRRFVTVSPKTSERYMERVEGIKSRRVATNRIDNKLELNKNEEIEGTGKWMALTSYESFKTGDWTTNCVIGAVVYFLTTRQVKAV